MTGRRSLCAGAAAALLTLALSGGAAWADFNPPALVSGTATLQADFAYETAMAADGEYLVFTGSYAGTPGVYRKDLQTGELDVVAYGDAGSPSISANGQDVAFTTTDAAPGSPLTVVGQSCTSVYVRDMAIGATPAAGLSPGTIAPRAFTLASAASGQTASLTYGNGPGTGSSAKGCPGGGSATTPGGSLSADGHQVVFTVVGRSDLTTGSPARVTTPPAQVAVRDLASRTTTLVTQTMASLGATPQPVPGGGALTDLSVTPTPELPQESAGKDSDVADSTATISADGSTVAWMGTEVPLQAPAAAQDAPSTEGGTPPVYAQEYAEPLWRRIAAGPASPTRRILGGDDPACPGGCAGPLNFQFQPQAFVNNLGSANGGQPTSTPGPDRGSLLSIGGFKAVAPEASPSLLISDAAPRLSADGNTVAVLSTQPDTGTTDYQLAFPTVTTSNAYVVNMVPGLSRAQATQPLTEWASDNFTASTTTADITGVAISPQGDEIAFVTQRTVFPLTPPTLTTPQISQVSGAQLYVANLADGTMQLVSGGYDDQPANSAVSLPSFSSDSGPLAFASGAGNLVYGAQSDLQTNGSALYPGQEAFTLTPILAGNVPGHTTIGQGPAPLSFIPSYRLGLSVTSQRSGAVQLHVVVPGYGSLRARAEATITGLLTTPPSTTPHHRVRGRGARARTDRVRHRPSSARDGPAATARLKLASATQRTVMYGSLVLTLRPAARYRALIARAGGLSAEVSVRFTSPGGPPLTQTVSVEFTAPRAPYGARRHVTPTSGSGR